MSPVRQVTTSRKRQTLMGVAAFSAACTMGLSGAGAATAATPAPTSPPQTFAVHAFDLGYQEPAGPTAKVHGFKTYFIGTLDDNWACADYFKGLENNPHAKPGSLLKGVSTYNMSLVRYIVGNYGDPKTNDQGAAYALAVHDLTGGADFNKVDKKFYLDRLTAQGHGNVVKLLNQELQAAKLYHGGYNVKVTKVTPVLPGTKGTISALVTTRLAPHRVVPNLSGVKLTLGGASVVGREPTRTAANGTLTFNYLRTGTTPVGYRINLTTPNVDTILITDPPNSQQRLLKPFTKKTVVLRGGYQSKFGKATVSYNCTVVCNGSPPLTVKYRNGTDSLMRVTTKVGTDVIGAFLINPGQPGQKTYTVHDTDKVIVTTQVFVDGEWTTPEVVGSITIDCPPLPAVIVQLSCGCTGGGVTVMPITNSSAHNEEVIIQGVTTPILPGTTSKAVVLYAHGKNLKFDVKIGAQRTDKTWEIVDAVSGEVFVGPQGSTKGERFVGSHADGRVLVGAGSQN